MTTGKGHQNGDDLYHAAKGVKTKHMEALNAQQKLEQLKKLYEIEYINFPSNSGVSGKVFASGEIYFSNRGSKDANF
jgi:hypothetical protein